MNLKTGIEMNRRNFVKTGLCVGLGSFLPLIPQTAFAREPLSVGTKTIRTLSDGSMTFPINFMFPDVPQEQLLPFLQANGFGTETIEQPCNLTLVDDGERRILFDAGAGSNFMPSTGKVIETLDAAGIALDSITDVIFTHGHPDHLWGILDEFDEVTFTGAQLHFPRVEWDFWRDEDTVNKMSEGRQTFAIGAKNRLDLMEERVQLFDDGAEILPGIEAFDTPGHTPGHMAFGIHAEVGSGDVSMMVVGDALTNYAVSFEKPDWYSGSDQDRAQGSATRLKLLDRVAADKMQIIGYHLPGGGLGRVERNGSAFRFVQEA